MTIISTSRYKHLQHYWADSIDDQPIHADMGDLFHLFTEDDNIIDYIFNGTTWDLYNEDGIDATGVVAPTGASGIRGWLSGIYNVLKNTSLSIINKNSSGTEIFTTTNPAYTQQIGNTLQEQLTETDAIANVLSFSENISTIELYNTDAVNTGIFNVNGIDITVPPEKYFKSTIGGTPSTEVTISGATTYIVSRYE